jgi:hypothetical protein
MSDRLGRVAPWFRATQLRRIWVDKRASPRTRLFTLGQVAAATRDGPIFCTVIDLSDDGVRLRTAAASEIPGRFRLSIPSQKLEKDVDVRWRDNDEIGGSFTARS